MRELPILFSTPMIQAILDGRKTMTRRAIKDRDITNWFDIDVDGTAFAYIEQSTGDSYKPEDTCPYQPGDLLWVRETTWVSECKRYIAQGLERGHSSKLDIVNLETGKRYIWQHGRSDYAPADGMVLSWSWEGRHLRSGRQTEEFDVGFADVDTAVKIMPLSGNIILKKYDAQFRKKLPSIFMPKAAARIWLEVTNVRVERLQEITEEDAVKEGIKNVFERNPHYDGTIGSAIKINHLTQFRELWDSINAKRGYGWESNPWVWVIEFKRVDHD